MRDDMFEVIIERPRINSRARYPRRLRRSDNTMARIDPERLRFAAPIRPNGASKYLNENLAPLRRYLERQVNRPWDKVWSEISAKLKPGSTVQQHVRDHVGDFVATDTFIKDGAVWLHRRYHFFGEQCPIQRSNVKLYVDPRTGLLRQNKYARTPKLQKATAAREQSQRMREIAPFTQAHRFGERGWWEVSLAPTNLPPLYIERSNIDVVLKAGFSDLMPHVLYGRAGVYAIAKRQMSRQEIARLLRASPRSHAARISGATSGTRN
jgi:hypothetical protein